MKKTNRSHVRQTGKSVRVFKSGANLGSARLRAIPFALAIAFGSASSFADPAGSVVEQGQAAISAANGITTIHQMSDRAVVNWQSFNVNAGEAVKFIQPSSTAAILNRVTGGSVSNINGLVEGNGRVYLINPNGIVVGANGVVNVNGGFVASTKSLADSAFMSGGALVFTGESTGSIQILGKVQSAQGDVILIAPKIAIEKTGSLIAGQTIKLVAANEVELSNGKFTVKPKAGDAGQLTIEGALEAAKVQLAANNNNLGALAINTSGTIRATGIQTNPDGSVTIMAEGQGSNIRVSGTIEASNYDSTKNGGSIVIGRDVETGSLAKSTDVSGAMLKTNKGFVETSGDYLATDGVAVKAAKWLLDPSDIQIKNVLNNSAINGAPSAIAPTGSNGTTSIVATSTIQNAINAGASVTIQTTNNPDATSAGNITIIDKLDFANNSNTDATLSLIADNGIIQNSGATMTTSAVSGKTGLVNISMEAKGNYRGNTTANANSRGIAINSTITTNGDVTLMGTVNTTSGSGVSFGNGASITAAKMTVTGIATSPSPTNAIYSGITFNGTNVFKSTGSGESKFTGSSSTQSNTAAGIMASDGAKLTLDSTIGTIGTIVLDGSNTNTGYRGVRIGGGGGDANITTTKGNVTFQNADEKSQVFLRGKLDADGIVTFKGGTNVDIYNNSSVIKLTDNSTINLISKFVWFGEAGLPTLVTETGGSSTVNIKADRVILAGGAINTGSNGTVNISTYTSGKEILVGANDVTSVTTKMGLTQAELNSITAKNLFIGDTASTGNITVSGVVSTAITTGNITLQTGGAINITGNLSAASDKDLTLQAVGDVNVGAEIKQTGTGNIVIAAGLGLGAGIGSGGQVKGTGDVNHTGSGNTYIYTGTVADSAKMSDLNGAFSTLYLTTSGANAQNAQSNTATDLANTIAGGAGMQVMYREKIAVDLIGNNTLANASKTYGEVANNTDAVNAIKGVNNPDKTLEWTTSNGNKFNLSSNALIDTLSVDNLSSNLSSAGKLKANGTAYGTSSSTYSVTLGQTLPTLTINQKSITTASIAAVTDAVYGTAKPTGVVTLGGDVLADDKVIAANTAIVKDAVTSGSGNLKAGDYYQTVTGGLTSGNINNDANNYSFVDFTTGEANYHVAKLNVSVIAQHTSLNYTGALLTQNQSTSSFINPDRVIVSGLATGAAVGLYRSALNATGDDVSNYDIQFVDDHLVIAYSGANKAPTPTETYTRIAGDVVNLSPVSFAVGVTAVTAAGDEADPNICYAWGQRDGGSVIVHTLLKPSYLGLRHAKTDTQEAMGNGGASSAHSANPCGHDVATNLAQSNNI